MSWAFIAILAYLLMATNFVFDKVILRQVILAPVVYAIYVGLSSSYAILMLPFAFDPWDLLAKPGVILMGLLSGALFISALGPLYKAIQQNEVSKVAPFVGVLTAVFTLFFGALFGVEHLDIFQLFIFSILVIGAFFVAKPKFTFLGVIAGALFGLSFVLIKAVYLQTAFFNGFVLARLGEVIFAASLIIFSKKNWELVKENWRSTKVANLGFAALFKAFAGFGFVLQNYAIFLGSVVLVQAMAGIQYAFVWLIVAIVYGLWKKLESERFSHATWVVVFGFVLVALSLRPTHLAPGVKEYGVNFSEARAKELGLDWKKTYLATLDDLGVKNIYLPLRDSPDVDWQVNEAAKRGAKTIRALGPDVLNVTMRSNNYPSMPSSFWFKANLVGLRTKLNKIVVTELEAEDLRQFRKNLKLARNTGFPEVYFLGVEWWYQEKIAGRPEIWEEAKKLFK